MTKMTKQIARRPADRKAALRKTNDDIQRPMTVPLLKLVQMDEGAVFCTGKDNSPVEEDAAQDRHEKKLHWFPENRWVVDIDTFERGWLMQMGKGKPPKKIMRNYREGVPSKDEALEIAAEEKGKTWAPCFSFIMVCVDGDAKGLRVLYSAANVGMSQFYADLTDACADRLDVDEENCFPVLKLGYREYTNDYGDQVAPKFDIVGWTDETLTGYRGVELDGATELEETPSAGGPEDDVKDAEVVEEEAPKTTRRRRRPRD